MGRLSHMLMGLLFSLGLMAAGAEEYETVELDETTEISIAASKGASKNIYIWLPTDYDLEVSATELMARLGAGANEVWLADLLRARFLPPTPASVDQVPPEDVARVIEAAYDVTRKPVYLVAADRGAVFALRGSRLWRSRYPKSNALQGVILWHPLLYASLPEPGEEAHYLPVVHRTHVPVFIYQPKLSTGRWRLNKLVTALEAGGSTVRYQLLPKIRDRFFFRQDATASEQSMTALVPDLLVAAASSLQKARGEAP